MDQAKALLTHFSGPESYFLFYFMLTGCGIGIPMNSDFVLIAASVLAAFGYFKLSILMPVALLGLLSGDSINYWVARTYGPKILAVKPFRYLVSPEKLKQGEDFLARKGTRFLFLVRFLPLIRTALYFAAGSMQIKPKSFYILNASSTIIYLLIVMNGAYYAGENIDPLMQTFKQVQFFLLGAVVLIFATWLFRKRMKRPVHT
jgi:membrane-associated protein